jgi:DNA-directed RNA polymerase specialized sigma24 family protein
MLMRQIEYRRRHLNPTGILQNGWDDVGHLGHAPVTSRGAEASVDAQTVLKALPDHYASILRRHYLDGLTLEELANTEGVTPECMRKRHERAIKYARKIFSKEE